ncbi:MAG: HAD-IIIA family hydrolase [Bacteroidales bacterium]|nr:HAD-IIIA family hydrolase [Bacteroidales bacterium]
MDFSIIKAFAFDVDGVFTDGGILCDLEGELFRTFDAKDGFAVRMATMKGYPVAIITGGRSGSIRARFRTCGVPIEDVYLGSRNKIEDLDSFCQKYNLKREDILYVGDDIPDIECMSLCGIGACPCDASEETLASADYVSKFPGGKGCIRDVVSSVMKARGEWNFDVLQYKKMF